MAWCAGAPCCHVLDLQRSRRAAVPGRKLVACVMERSDRGCQGMLESPAPKVPTCGLHSGLQRYSSSRTLMRTLGDLPDRCPVRPSAYLAAAMPHRSSPGGIRRSRICESTVCMRISARNAVVRRDSIVLSPQQRLERPRRPMARRQEERTSPARPWGSIFPSHSQPGRVERRARPKPGLLPSRTDAVCRR